MRILFLLSFILFACGEKGKEEVAFNEQITAPSESSSDSIMPDLSKDIAMINKNVDKDFVENKKKIEKTFGQQWDFCRCIKVNDSLDRLIKSGIEVDDTFLASFEEVDTKCKAFLVMNPNQTPEERALHEKKVQKCLKSLK